MKIPSRDQLLEEAVCSMASRIDDARAHRAREAEAAQRRSLTAKDRLKEGARKLLRLEEQRSPTPRLDQRAGEKGRQRMAVGAIASTASTASAEAAVSDMASQLCQEWGWPNASPLARAWLDGSTFDVEMLMDTDNETLALIVGVAAAAAVLALVLLLRRGRSISAAQHTLSPSPDFSALLTLASGHDDVAAVAARIQSEVTEPWSWTLASGLFELSKEGKLSESDKRTLLAALSDRGICGVSAFAPKAGVDLNKDRMIPKGPTTTDDRWVVSSDTPRDRCGYSIADHVELRAEVEVCTVDWWVLTSCEVGRVIVERADSLVAGGLAKASSWRAPWGFTFPEDLRELPEAQLDSWRQRLLAELNPRYRDRPDRQLALVGKPGEAFESSMETEDGRSPVGDAFVAEVVLRDGIPQYGLACPGGSPLLLAVVRTRPSRGGA